MELTEVIERYYPKPETAGRRLVGIERMPRIQCFQHCFDLSDPDAEEAPYNARAMRQFMVGIDLGWARVLGETAICKFRHLTERYNLGDELFRIVNVYLEENGMKVSRGTVDDATIINAPRSTKNKDRQRDPEMRQTRKGNQRYFGMKAHFSVDRKTKMIHSVAATAAKAHDSQVLEELLHG